MNLTNRLVNPTPYDVKWNWDKGIVITIKSDGYVDLTADQSRDFQRGQPGSERVQDGMRELGLFIMDMDRSYESQALEALESCADYMMSRYNDMVNRLRRDRAEKGISENPEAFQEIVRQTGYEKFKQRADAIRSRASFLRTEVEGKADKQAAQKMDPTRTLPFTNPPKVFPSSLALQMFLRDKGNEELKEKWTKWYESVTRPAKVATKKDENADKAV